MIQLKFIPILACIALACDPTVASAQHQAHDSTADILADFEAEAERRRGEEGDNFDEESYQFERAIMERRAQLDEQRIAIDEEFNRKRDELSKSPNGQDQNAWQELDQDQQRAFEALDEQYQALDRENQQYWTDREDDDE